VIEIFPERMLDGSVHTAVLVGILVLWFATETFGWSMVGLVVPGYLAAIAIAAPMSFSAILLESVLTHAAVVALGEVMPRSGLWMRIFGRDRFLLVLLLSVPIRLFVEGLVSVHASAVIEATIPGDFTRGTGFFSIGVVLVPLTANVFWKLGLARGAVQIGGTTFLTWVVLRGMLIPLTNFHFGAFELTFEGVARDFLAVPKAYVLLLVTAAVASRNNARYGWDAGGILVPALLAIAALDPLKLLATLVEVLILVTLWRGLLSFDWVRRLNLGGPRRIVSIYVSAYVIKLCVALIFEHFNIQFQVSDAYGFGYLLTSLLSIRAIEKRGIVGTMVPTLITTVQGLVLGLLASLLLSRMLPPRLPLEAPAPTQETPTPIDQSILRSLASARPAWPDDADADARWYAWVRGLANLVDAPTLTGPAELRARGMSISHTVTEGGRSCIGAHPPRHVGTVPDGLPSVWWCGGNGPILYVPRPLGDPDSLVAAGWLAQNSDMSGLIVAGVDESVARRPGARPLPDEAQRFRAIRAALGDYAFLLVRTRPDGDTSLDARSSDAANRLGLTTAPLGDVAVRFDESHGDLDALWERLRRTDGLLTVSFADLSRSVHPALDAADAAPPRTLEDLVADRVALSPQDRLPNADLPMEDRVAATELVLGTALRRARAGDTELPGAVRRTARRFGIEADQIVDADGVVHWVLAEGTGAPRGWGTWVIRTGSAAGPWSVIAPFSTDEMGTAQVASRLFEQLNARTLWTSDHGQRYGHGNAHFPRLETAPLEQIAIRVALRPEAEWDAQEEDPKTRLLVIRRQQDFGRPIEAAVLSQGAELVLDREEVPLIEQLQTVLSSWPVLGLNDGRLETAALNVYSEFPVYYVNSLAESQAAVLWVAGRVLDEVAGTEDHARRVAWYAEQEVPIVGPLDAPAPPPEWRPLPLERYPEVWRALRHHAETSATGSLHALRDQAEVTVIDTGLRLSVIAKGEDFLCALAARADRAPARWPLAGCWGPP
jgi:hypothetical protein